MFGNPPLFQGHMLVVTTSVLGGIVAIHVGLLGLLAIRYDAFIRELLYCVCVRAAISLFIGWFLTSPRGGRKRWVFST